MALQLTDEWDKVFEKSDKVNLLRYCELDTWAMVRIWQELKKEVM